jgi:ParB family chromosome partitioning protein
MPERKLGRGLDGLLRGLARQDAIAEPALTGPVTSIPLGLLDPNPQQPRQVMNPAELEHLKASIREHGVLQPILVRPRGDRYQIVAGERRFRAAQATGLAEVPAVVRDVPDDRMLEVALTENLQREDLDPIEKARSFKAFLDITHLTQEQAAQRLGLDRSTIANMIRLLDLPDPVQVLVRSGQVAMGHARALLALSDPRRQVALAARVVREGLSVRQVEALTGPRHPPTRSVKRAEKAPHVRDLEARLREALGTKVTVEEGTRPGTGRIIIEFFSHDDAERVLARIL